MYINSMVGCPDPFPSALFLRTMNDPGICARWKGSCSSHAYLLCGVFYCVVLLLCAVQWFHLCSYGTSSPFRRNSVPPVFSRFPTPRCYHLHETGIGDVLKQFCDPTSCSLALFSPALKAVQARSGFILQK